MSEFYGMFEVKNDHSNVGKKVIELFEKLKRKAEESDKSNKVGFNSVKYDPRFHEHEEPDFNRMRQEALKSLHLTDEVLKTEEGFEVT